MRLSFKPLLLALVIALPLSGTARAAGKIPVNVSYQPAFSHALAVLAKEKGWFDEAGLDVKMLNFESGVPQAEAMGAGSVDISFIGSTATIIAAARKLTDADLFFVMAEVTPLFTIMTPPTIKSVEELRGKKILTTVGSSMHYFLDLALSKFNMTDKDVQLIHMEPSDGMIAFIGKQGDAITPLAPQVWVIKDKIPDATIMFDGTMLGKAPGKPIDIRMMDVGIVTKKFARKHPEAVQAFLKVWFRCVDYINNPATRAKAIEEIMNFQNKTYNAGLKLDRATWMLDHYVFFDAKENAKLFADKVVEASMDSEAKFHVQNKRIPEAPKPENYISGKYIDEYLKAGK